MKCDVIFSTAAARDYRNLDRQIIERVNARLAVLSESPLEQTYSKRLIGQGDLRSSRVGSWRILYVVDGAIINVVRIRHRREVYNDL